ncbi:MAG: GDSL family lipase [Lachnospiraceae bacterium]|nr:GDSL family lipase [Lachnospiraceae bacterium]
MDNLKEYRFLPTEQYVKILGRTFMLDDCRVLSLSASGVEFTYEGTRLEVIFYGDSTTDDNAGGSEAWRDQARVGVIVDGIMHLDTVIKKPVEKFVVCGDDPKEECAEHTVRIIKLSEPRMSTVGLGEITVTAKGEPKPTPLSDKYIEFIGDSITCGYGVDAPDEWYLFATGTENVTKAFSYKTAKKLCADYSLVSYSGHGLISGYTDDPEIPKLEELIQPYYEIFSYSYNTFRGQRMETRKWDFSGARKPDTIVINLGTNDESYVQSDEDKKAAFLEDYVDFLGQVHEANPTSRIIVAFGLMGDGLFDTEKEAVSEFKESSGFGDVYIVRLTPQDYEKNGYGACWHPSEKSHEGAACELSAFIKSLGGRYAL